VGWTRRLLIIASVLCLAATAAAQGGERSPIALDGAQLLGAGTPINAGWFSCNLRISNNGSDPIEGSVELTSRLSWARDQSAVVTRAPFAVPPGGSVALQLPTHGFFASPPELRAEARDAAGNVLTGIDLPAPRSADPLLFSLAVPMRAAPWLRGQPLLAEGRHPLRGSYDLPTLDVAAAQVQPTSGALVLPQRAAGYGGATVVLSPSDVLTRASDQQRQALADWLLAGGSLAVVVSRPEDLRFPFLTALVGARPAAGRAPAELTEPRTFLVAPDNPGSSPPLRRTARPGPLVAPTLQGYGGGNLRATQWGAAATYGLGELHLLGFDPTGEDGASDPWVHLQLMELIRHAYDRKIHVALPHGECAVDANETREIRRLLDPNEGTRWAIAVATLVLLLYSVLAGPLGFHLAARRQRPLRALWQLPIWSLLTLLIVVGLGVLAKGMAGEARHVTLIEAGAGMSRGAVTRFRAFYSPASSELAVGADEYGNVLDLAGPAQDEGRTLVVDRDGARLEGFRAKPWQTVLVREDGFTELGAGINLVAVGQDVLVENRTGRDLVGVLVRAPSGSAHFFDRVAEGQQVAASSGDSLPGTRLPTTGGLGLGALLERLNDTEPRLGDAWLALQNYSQYDTRWWPEGVPTLIAQLAGGEGENQDSGLRLREDRVLVRVVGFGGRR